MKTALFYLFSFGVLTGSYYGHSELFTAFQVVMWALSTLFMVSTLAVIAGNEAAINARKGAEPSGLPKPVSNGLYGALAVTTAMLGAPVLAAFMVLVFILNVAAQEKLK